MSENVTKIWKYSVIRSWRYSLILLQYFIVRLYLTKSQCKKMLQGEILTENWFIPSVIDTFKHHQIPLKYLYSELATDFFLELKSFLKSFLKTNLGQETSINPVPIKWVSYLHQQVVFPLKAVFVPNQSNLTGIGLIANQTRDPLGATLYFYRERLGLNKLVISWKNTVENSTSNHRG